MKNSSPKNQTSNPFGTQNIRQGAFVISFFTIISAILGLIRDRIFASKFLVSKIGEVNQSLDVYYAAFFIPDTLYFLIFLGALSSAFIPVFTSLISKKEEKKAFYVANLFLNLSLAGLVVLSIFIFVLAPYLIKFITPGFSPEKQHLTVSLIRVMLLSPLFFGISNTAGGILNSYKRFTIFAIAPCLYNLGIIFGSLTFYKSLAIYGPAIGVIIGAFLHMIVQVFGAHQLGFRYRPVFDFKNKEVIKIFKLMIPRSTALAVERINKFVFLIIASTLGVGSVSIINLSSNLQSFPVSFFGIAIATATFPFLAETASLNKVDDFKQNLSKGISQILYLILPASLILILLRAQIVRIILGAGHFGWTDTKLTAACLGIFSFSLFAQGIIPLLCRSFYALKDTITPLKLSLISALLNILASLLFTRNFMIPFFQSFFKLKNGFDPRVVGLALAFSLSSVVYLILLWQALKRRLGVVKRNLGLVILKIVLASLVMGLFVQLGKLLFGSILDLSAGLNVLIQFCLASFFGGAAYILITTKIFKLEEANKFINTVFGFLKR